ASARGAPARRAFTACRVRAELAPPRKRDRGGGKETGGGPGEEPPPEVAEAGLVRDEPIPLRRVRPVAWRRTRPSPRGGTGHSISRDSRVRSHRNPAELPARGAGEAVGAPRRAGSVFEPKKHTPSRRARSARAP